MPTQLVQAYNDLLYENGVRESKRYFSTPDEAAQVLQQQAEQPPEPDPEMIKAQQEMQIDAQKAQSDMQVDRMKAEAQIARENWVAEQQMKLKALELGVEIELEGIRVKNEMRGPGVGDVPTVQ
jgi:uncharacterized protein (DUF3084 family)